MVDGELALEPNDQPLDAILVVPELGSKVAAQFLAQLRMLQGGVGENKPGLDGFVHAEGGGSDGPSSQGVNVKLEMVLLLQDAQVRGLNLIHPLSILYSLAYHRDWTRDLTSHSHFLKNNILFRKVILHYSEGYIQLER